MPEYFTEKDVLQAINKFIQECGSQAAACKELEGISQSYLSDIVRGNTTISAHVARQFGFEKQEAMFTKLAEVHNEQQPTE